MNPYHLDLHAAFDKQSEVWTLLEHGVDVCKKLVVIGRVAYCLSYLIIMSHQRQISLKGRERGA